VRQNSTKEASSIGVVIITTADFHRTMINDWQWQWYIMYIVDQNFSWCPVVMSLVVKDYITVSDVESADHIIITSKKRLPVSAM